MPRAAETLRAGHAARTQAPGTAALRPRRPVMTKVREERVRMTRLRQTIARRLKDAQEHGRDAHHVQ
jgi:pyruvate/2-oxoglutarate dehydrogenase complex dihydrolipoamide acyltransferase (E2) component